MPAVTVEDIPGPAARPRAGRGGRGRAAGTVGHYRAIRVRGARASRYGVGSPVFSAPALADPFMQMDQMGEVEYVPGASRWGHALAPAPRVRDRHVHHRRRVPPPGLHGGGGLITNGDTQWMTAGSGLLHIEAAARGAGRERRPVPRRPAVGEPPARRSKMGRPALPGHSGRGDVALLPPRPRRVRSPGHRGRPGRPPGSRRHPHADHVPHATVQPGAQPTLPGHASSTRWSTRWPGAARWAGPPPRSAPAGRRVRQG